MTLPVSGRSKELRVHHLTEFRQLIGLRLEPVRSAAKTVLKVIDDLDLSDLPFSEPILYRYTKKIVET